jgi:hypothetical protein
MIELTMLASIMDGPVKNALAFCGTAANRLVVSERDVDHGEQNA